MAKNQTAIKPKAKRRGRPPMDAGQFKERVSQIKALKDSGASVVEIAQHMGFKSTEAVYRYLRLARQ